jgi:multicomponent Na+:H+ antiporter subunit C
MQWELSLLVGFLFGAGIYLVLASSFLRVLMGFMILSNAVNLLLIANGGLLGQSAPPIVGGQGVSYVDPLPHALILTAIVIGFGVTAYLVVLLYRIFLDHGTTQIAALFRSEADKADTEPPPPREGP